MGQEVTKPLNAPETVHFGALYSSLPRMDGKVVAVTGCTSGLGLVCARTCGKLGARVVMLNRPSKRADEALQKLKDEGIQAELVHCDLGSFESTRACAVELKKVCAADGIYALCNNGGVMGLPDQATVDGCDVQAQVNHLSHFLLTAEVWPLLEKAAEKHGEARVVNHSSGARKKPSAAPIDPKYFGKNGGNLGGNWWPLAKWHRYQQSKKANVMFTYELMERAQKAGSKVKAVVAHPGATLTDLQMKTYQTGETGWLDAWVLSDTMKKAQSEEDGAQGIVKGCCAKDVNIGDFYGPVESVGLAVTLPPEREPASEKSLWEVSLATTGAKWPF